MAKPFVVKTEHRKMALNPNKIVNAEPYGNPETSTLIFLDRGQSLILAGITFDDFFSMWWDALGR